MEDISNLSALLAQIDRHKKIYRIQYYKPYPKQAAFHNAKGRGTDRPAAQRLLLGGNQIGKCSCKNSYIEHPDGTRSTFGERFKVNRPFWVNSFAESSCRESLALYPILKEKHNCVRLWFENGQWFDCALEHRVLSYDKTYVFVEQLLTSVPNLRLSNLECDQLTHASSVPHWNRKLQGFLVGCLDYLRLCDAQLHSVQVSVRAWFRQSTYVQAYSLRESYSDGLGNIDTSNLSPILYHLSSQDEDDHLWGRSVGFLDYVFCKVYRLVFRSIQVVQRLCVVGVVQLQSNDEEHQGQFVFSQACKNSLLDGNRIVAYEDIPAQEVYDFTVPETGNYISCGIVHHNTFCGAMEAAFHLTGRYPDWWEGTRFYSAIDMMVGSNTNETCRDIVQRELFGNPLDDKELGTGTIPIDCIGKTHRKAGVPNAIDSCSIKHISGGWSKVYLRAYEQGFKKFMGIRFEVGWLDEEPPKDIWAQFLRAGLSRKNSILYITMTPEEGMTEVVTQFMNNLSPGQAITQAGWDDAAHFTEEMKEQKLMAFSPHEREMRSKGTPLMGAGLVFGTPDNDILIEPFAIPRHWPRINGIDFGWDHPSACGSLAWDRDSDCIYLTNEYRESKALPIVQAQAIRAWGDWIPVAWPHDGLNTEKGTGEQLRQAYIDAGLNFLPWKATNPPQAGQAEGEGGNSVESSILDMVERMETGRFKVFTNCKQFMEEKRMYHRDLKGKLVKLNDDLISAVRYGVMMIRHARTISVAPRRVSQQRGKSNWG